VAEHDRNGNRHDFEQIQDAEYGCDGIDLVAKRGAIEHPDQRLGRDEIQERDARDDESD
jgi:hypothetical protein